MPIDNTALEVKSRLNVVDLVGEYVRLTKAGSSFKGLCPFHNEKTPSFTVSEERQSWHCFGCQKGGDVFTFLMEAEGVGFREALKILADRVGLELPSYNPQIEKKNKSAYEVLEKATAWYEEQLHSDRGGVAKQYLLERGISEESMRAFRLGYAPEGWNNIGTALHSLGYAESDIEPTGLLVQKTNDLQPTTHNGGLGREAQDLVVGRRSSVVSRGYDRFRDRILFPIGDILGRVIGYSARVLPGADEKQGKYINTPETTLYHKSKTLYGIAQAKQSIKKENRVIVVEGNMDVIAMHQAGFGSAVAVSGTAMTAEHIGILRRYTKNVILFFDMDSAGREAAYKSTIACLQGEMNVSLIHIEGGKDAAELAQSHPEDLRASVRGARSAMDFFCEEILAQSDLGKSEGKKEASEKLLPLLSALVNEVEQSDWARRIAERLDVETTAVSAGLNRFMERQSGGRPIVRGEQASERAVSSVKGREEVLRSAIVGRMLKYPLVWKNTMDYVSQVMEPEVSAVFRRGQLLEQMFSLGEAVAYDFDQFRLAVEEDALIRTAHDAMAGLGEFDADGNQSEVREWEEVQTLIKNLEKEVWKTVLENLVKDIRSADQAGDTLRREALTRQFGELSQKMQNF